MRHTSFSRNTTRVLVALALGSLGALAAASLATADRLSGITTTLTLSTPSVSVPGVSTPTPPTTATVAVPGLPGTDTTATSPGGTTPTATNPTAESIAPLTTAGNPNATAAPRDPAESTGIRLPSGGLSVTASSLRSPTRLLVDRVHLSPATVRARRQLVILTLRVRDSAGHLVRGATVNVTGNPTAAARTARATSTMFGTATIRVQTTPTGHASRLFLLIRVTGGHKGAIQTARLLAVPVSLP